MERPPSTTIRIGLDLGGTKIASVALSLEGAELASDRRPTPRGDYEATVAALADMAWSAMRDAGADADACTIGVGIPGSIHEPSGLVQNANSHWLNGRPLRDDLRAALGQDVRLANDANCFAVSEAVDGAGAGKRIVFGVILGTGAGAGLVIDRAPLVGVNGIGSEWGLNALPWPTRDELDRPMPSDAFRDGCIDAWCSGTGLARDFERAAGRTLRGPELVAAAESGEEEAEAALRRYESRVARALAMAVNLIDPDVIILGGGMGRVARLYDNIPRLWRENEWIASRTIETPVVPPVHGDDSGKRGAAWLWLDEARS